MSKWKRVEDEMPKMHTAYLSFGTHEKEILSSDDILAYDGKRVFQSCVTVIDGGKPHFSHDGPYYEEVQVSHWRHMPKPPVV